MTLGALLLVAALPWAGGLVRPRSRADVPNVLLIVLDTTRVDRLSAYGYDRPTTPALERIAAEGLAFRRAYAASPWTLPSHASMFTGEYAAVHNATWEHQRLDERLPTLAEHLSEMGLRTAAFSRQVWLSDETGLMRGFEDFYDLYWRSTTALVAAWRLGVDKIKERRGFEDKGAALVTDRFKGWIDRHGDRPFFAFINYVEPHAYYQPPAPFREQFLAEERKDTPWGRAQNVAVQRHNAGDLVYSADHHGGPRREPRRSRPARPRVLRLQHAAARAADRAAAGARARRRRHGHARGEPSPVVAHRKGPVGPRSGSADPGRTAGIGAPRDRRGGRARFRGAVHASAGDGPVACFAASRAAHPPAQVRGAWEPEVHPGLGRGRGAVRRDRRPRGAEQPRRPSGRGPRRAARPPGGKGGNPGDGRGRRGSGLQRGAKAPPQVAGILGLNRSNVNMLE
ncbi:MAG: sulfatase-like hydrolase/transferase [Planctomycetota bacterium]